MTKALYLENSYLKECEAIITSIKNDKYVVLDKTIFYPRGGGQPHDTGRIICEDNIYDVIFVGKFDEISHEVDKSGLKIGEKVLCNLNWDRRYRLMRSHTAAHTLAAILVNDTGALITGNQLEENKVRLDFNLTDFEPQIFKRHVDKSNELFKQNIPVNCYELPRDEALKIPGVIKLAKSLPPNIPILRIVDIAGIDKQADGGTHVKNLREVGGIEIIKIENKGMNNRRIYFKLINKM